MSVEDAAEAIGLKSARGKSGAERLVALENGEKPPTIALLRRMAERYRRPLIAFYLNEPPPRGERGEDFRRVPGAPPPEFDPNLDALIRNVRARHSLIKSLLQDEESPLRRFVGSCSLSDEPESVAESIIAAIGFDLEKFRRSNEKSDYHFSYLRSRLESIGIYVMLIGDLGSHHSKIGAAIFRGYSLADSTAPLIVINDNDARIAWSFTALHEAAHLWLGQSGVSGAAHNSRAEQFCNDVAGCILLPAVEIAQLDHLRGLSFTDVLAGIFPFAKERRVSRAMVAYQLLRKRMISRDLYLKLVDQFRDDFERSKIKEPATEREGGGPNYYVVKRHRLGAALLSLAQRSLLEGTLSPTKAARLLGVKPVSVFTLLDATAA